MQVFKYPLNKVPNFSNLKELVYLRANLSNPIAFKFKEKKIIKSITSSKFKDDMEFLGTCLFEKGIRNSKVALIGENSYNWILSYFAVVSGGNVIVPIDKELSEEEIKILIDKSNADVLIYSEMYKDVICGIENIKLICMSEFNVLIAEGEESLKNGNRSYVDYKVNNNELCSIIYTSGTTGNSKGVMLSHKNIASDVISACQNVFIAGDSMLTLPLHHTFAFSAGVAVMLLYGLTICINNNIRTFKDDLIEYKAQNLCVVPLYVENMYKNIWMTVKAQKKEKIFKLMTGLSSKLRSIGIDIRRNLFKSILNALGGNLDLIISGGAPINDKYINFFDNLGITVLNGYGITECSPVVAVNRNKCFIEGSAGLIISCNKVKEKDGEILVKGSNVMLGYYDNEQETKNAFDGEWFKTGDLGYIKDDYLYITGRKKNLIILSNGENISPEELEDYIKDIPNVEEVVVYSQNDVITAEIYAHNTENIKNEITDLNRSLPIYKQIQKVCFRENEFEKTTTKKIKR